MALFERSSKREEVERGVWQLTFQTVINTWKGEQFISAHTRRPVVGSFGHAMRWHIMSPWWQNIHLMEEKLDVSMSHSTAGPLWPETLPLDNITERSPISNSAMIWGPNHYNMGFRWGRNHIITLSRSWHLVLCFELDMFHQLGEALFNQVAFFTWHDIFQVKP